MTKKNTWHQELKLHIGISSKVGIIFGFIVGTIDGMYILLLKGKSVAFANLYSMMEVETTVLLSAILVYGGLGLMVGFLAGMIGHLGFRLKKRLKERAELLSFYATFMVIFATFVLIIGVISNTWLNNNIFGFRGLFMMIVLFIGCIASFNYLNHLIMYCYKNISSLRILILKRSLLSLAIIVVLVSISPSGYQLLFKNKRISNESGVSIYNKSIEKPDIIFIVIDILRADHLSTYGYPNKTSPKIDKIAEEGILFLNMFSQASWTKPSVATMLTSSFPSSHQVISHDKFKLEILSEKIMTLPEVLQNNGYWTAGFVANPHLAPLYNFNQGFNEYQFLKPSPLYRLAIFKMLRFDLNIHFVSSFYRDAAELNHHAFSWLNRQQRRPFFLYLHYMDPHSPYFVHPNHNLILNLRSLNDCDVSCSEEKIDLYDGEITYIDEHIGNLINILKKNRIYDNALIIITSDHGEEFQEHGGWSHGRTLYNEVIKIPLIVKLPLSKHAGMKSTNLVSTIDLAPFILKRAGVKVPSNMKGVSELISGSEDFRKKKIISEHGPTTKEGVTIRSLTSYDWKMIETTEEINGGMTKIELFNLYKDPFEKNDISSTNAEIVEEFLRELNNILKSAKEMSLTPETVSTDNAIREQLKSLGYIN